MKRYNPNEIEPKWQQVWDETNIYKAVDFDEKHPKYVMLTEFPYPSGDGLHLGHVREYTLGDIMARTKRMAGYNVLFPMGYDAFGLPAENYAIKHKVTPQSATDTNIGNFQKQFTNMGYSIDWSRSFRTSDPEYYKWTQWLFLQFYKEGLAYQDEIAINWCPHCKTGLANEEVVNGRHERCDTPVEKKLLKQWMLKITKYADRLIDGLQDVDYPSRIADQQVNWIGRSMGAEITFAIEGQKERITVFTTRPDTLYGATFMVLAPEHDLVRHLTTDAQKTAVEAYITQTAAKSEIERQDTDRQKTGVFTGAYAINPANQEKMPIWIADYVLGGYGTGAIMAVPAHDERDQAFAEQFRLPIVKVVEAETGEAQENPEFRRSIVAVVWNTKNQNVLTINWGKENGGYLFIGGGREDGEDIEKAALREIREETGYKHLTLVKKSAKIHHHYFAHSKNTPRQIEAYGLLFDLEDEERDEPQLEADEKGKFTFEWVHRDQVESTITDPLHLRVWDDVVLGRPYTGEGIMAKSGPYDGQKSSEVREKIVAELAERGIAKERVNYKLRDWIFSRQHYWGEPIPIIHCPKDGAVAVPEAQLPVELPPVTHYEPTDTGESPLSEITEWVNTTCPTCGGPAKRETDTMPNWAGSSWYYLRFFDVHNNQAFADYKKLKYWGMVDMYLGGMEHTTLHLLYSRFWHQFFYDQGLVPTPEPYKARRGQGIVLAADGSKMSKSKGNVINPNDIIAQGYGADALRLAIAFLAPYDQTTPWNPNGVAGTYRFLQRFWTLVQDFLTAPATDTIEDQATQEAALRTIQHHAIKRMSSDMERMSFNTAVAALMEGVNGLYKVKTTLPFGTNTALWQEVITTFTQLLAPLAPHLAEEIWHELGNATSVHCSEWPLWDESAIVEETVTYIVQVNGRVRATIIMPRDAVQAEVVQAARAHEKITALVSGDPKRIIFVPNKLVNFVV